MHKIIAFQQKWLISKLMQFSLLMTTDFQKSTSRQLLVHLFPLYLYVFNLPLTFYVTTIVILGNCVIY